MREVFKRLKEKHDDRPKPKHPGFCDKCWVDHAPAYCTNPSEAYYWEKLKST